MLLPFTVLACTLLILHNIFLYWFSRSIPRFFRHLSGLRLAKISFKPLTTSKLPSISFVSISDFSNWFGSLSGDGILLEPELEPLKIIHFLLGRRQCGTSQCEIEKKFILIRAVTFVMHGSEPLHFVWSHHGILLRAKTKFFSTPLPCFQNIRKTGIDWRTLAIICPFDWFDLIKLKNKEIGTRALMKEWWPKSCRRL